MGGLFSELGQSSGFSNIGQGIHDLFTGGGAPAAASSPSTLASIGAPGPGGTGAGTGAGIGPLLPSTPTPSLAEITQVPELSGGAGQGYMTGVMNSPLAASAGGPAPPTASPSFLQGFAQGFTGMTPGGGAPMGAGGEIGGGIGQLFHAINQLRNPQGLLESGLKQLTGVNTGQGGAQTPIVNVPSKPLQGPEQAQVPGGYMQAKSEDPLQALVKAAMIVAAL